MENKSNSPETDAAGERCYIKNGDFPFPEIMEHARKLERERDEARLYAAIHDFRPLSSVKAEMQGLLSALQERDKLQAELEGSKLLIAGLETSLQYLEKENSRFEAELNKLFCESTRSNDVLKATITQLQGELAESINYGNSQAEGNSQLIRDYNDLRAELTTLKQSFTQPDPHGLNSTIIEIRSQHDQEVAELTKVLENEKAMYKSACAAKDDFSAQLVAAIHSGAEAVKQRNELKKSGDELARIVVTDSECPHEISSCNCSECRAISTWEKLTSQNTKP